VVGSTADKGVDSAWKDQPADSKPADNDSDDDGAGSMFLP